MTQTLTDESDEESMTDSGPGSGEGEGGYSLWKGTGLHLCSSEPQAPASSSWSQARDPPPAQPGVGGLIAVETGPSGAVQLNQDEEVEFREGVSQGVDLLTLTFGMHKEEEEEEEKSLEEPSSASEDIRLKLPEQTQSTEEAEVQTGSCSVDQEEEEEEDSGYITRHTQTLT